jgi:hypothetical protein
MASRGERNNNPGNLEASPWTRSQPGYVGSDGRFGIFDTMENGIAAQVKLLINRYINKGYDTPNEIIWRYGNDPSTADDNSVRNYVKYVAKRLGINIDDPISAAQAGGLAQAMREFETGNRQTGVIGSTSSGSTALDRIREMERAFLRSIGLSDEAAGTMTNPDASPSDVAGLGVSAIFSSEFASRATSVVIGVILVALAIAAFLFLSEQKVVQQAVAKVT